MIGTANQVSFAGHCRLNSDIELGPKSATTGLMQRSKQASLFDYLVGAGLQSHGHRDTERFGCFEVDD
jgi:hypothetical protein